MPQKVVGSIPNQGTYGRQLIVDVSVSLPSSLSKVNKKISSGEDLKNRPKHRKLNYRFLSTSE